MYKNNAHSLAGPLQAALITVLFIVAMIYLTTTFGSRDPLWFWSKFDEQPAVIVAHCGGRAMVLQPGNAVFADFVTEFNRLISSTKRWDSLSLSEETENDYATNAAWVMVELKYSPPIRVHSQYPYFTNTDKLIVPLVGRHADSAAVFSKIKAVAESGAFHLPSNETLLRILTDGGVCPAG